jgi:H+/Cl- antiporter ClcA
LGGIVRRSNVSVTITNLNPDLLSILAVSGMAAVSSSVIGAPITAIILSIRTYRFI